MSLQADFPRIVDKTLSKRWKQETTDEIWGSFLLTGSFTLKLLQAE